MLAPFVLLLPVFALPRMVLIGLYIYDRVERRQGLLATTLHKVLRVKQLRHCRVCNDHLAWHEVVTRLEVELVLGLHCVLTDTLQTTVSKLLLGGKSALGLVHALLAEPRATAGLVAFLVSMPQLA